MALFKRFTNLFSRDTSTDDTPEIQADSGAYPFERGRPKRYDPFGGTGTPPPNEPGLYHIRDEDGGSLYIGETNDIDRRLREHIRAGKIQQGEKVDYKVAKDESLSITRRSVEKNKIVRHNPSRNQRGGGAGRPAR